MPRGDVSGHSLFSSALLYIYISLSLLSFFRLVVCVWGGARVVLVVVVVVVARSRGGKGVV